MVDQISMNSGAGSSGTGSSLTPQQQQQLMQTIQALQSGQGAGPMGSGSQSQAPMTSPFQGLANMAGTYDKMLAMRALNPQNDPNAAPAFAAGAGTPSLFGTPSPFNMTGTLY
jgi:hypothetical protein